MKKVVVKKGRYVDSITLMSIGDRILRLEGIENAEAQMGTWANKSLLEEIGFIVPKNTGADDLVLAVSGESEEYLEAAFAGMDAILDNCKPDDAEEIQTYANLESIDLEVHPYDLVQISLPGRYVYQEAEKALKRNLNLFIFSDGVSLEEEKLLKEEGKHRGLFVMGPDCGVAMLGGVCLGAGSIMSKGALGIVAASGSGAQEVACQAEKYGCGISAIIGTGGRDLYPEIGGIEMLHGLNYLERDEQTQVIVLLSKLADQQVMENVLKEADSITKPVVVVFMGAKESLYRNHKVVPAFHLSEAARKACALLTKEPLTDLGYTAEEREQIVQTQMSRYDSEQKYVRALYCGGTFTEEGLIHFSSITGVQLYSNLDTQYAHRLPDSRKSQRHSILDMGAEDFTARAPHPVFNPMLRLARIREELEDPETAVLLVDFITGPGVAEDPFFGFIQVVNEKRNERHVTCIVNICGSGQDPQNIEENKKLLQEAGVIVTAGSWDSVCLARDLMKALEKGNRK